MSTTSAPPVTYAMGESDTERQRLMRQGEIFRPLTSRLLVEAGISAGMRVLDLGCGAGDVSLLIADLVGPDGAVVGVDRDPRTLDLARSRAGEDRRLSFIEQDLNQLAIDDEFDACVGRLILFHLPDPVTVVRIAAGRVRPGGVVAFQDLDFSVMPPPSLPEFPLLRWCGTIAEEAMRRTGMEMRMGYRYRQIFRDAGLPEPRVRLETLLGGGPDFFGYHHVAEIMRTFLPLFERFEIASAAEIDIDTLADRLRDEVVAADGVMSYPPLAGAWSHVSA